MTKPGVAIKLPTGHELIRVIYEEYIHLYYLQSVWDSPITDKPVLEPCFAAAFHGIELCFLLLAEFLCDSRRYVAKRPRIERVAEDIRLQCQLLSELVDGELEEEQDEEGGRAGAGPLGPRLHLQQQFPFEACPPTTQCVAHSPGLAHLQHAVGMVLPQLTTPEYNSLCKVILNIAHAFASSFSRWEVGLGIEGQLNGLLRTLRLERCLHLAERHSNLDYNRLVRPEQAERTLTEEKYENAEDFFFRTVHLGTECWMNVALRRIASIHDLLDHGRWHVASARVLQVARILHYLGDHIVLLMSMNHRDYCALKVELEGTSGAGSAQVKEIRAAVMKLLRPFREAVLARVTPPGVDGIPFTAAMQPQQAVAVTTTTTTTVATTTTATDTTATITTAASTTAVPAACSAAATAAVSAAAAAAAAATAAAGGCSAGAPGAGQGAGGAPAAVVSSEIKVDRGVLNAVIELYGKPDSHIDLYNYAKALEHIESALLGGFFFKHFLLAANIIGNDAPGTIKRTVAGLRRSYETPLFPVLDVARSELCKHFDVSLAAVKGRIVEELGHRYVQRLGTAAAQADGMCGATARAVAMQLPVALQTGVDLSVFVKDEAVAGPGECPFGKAAEQEGTIPGAFSAFPFGGTGEEGGAEGTRERLRRMPSCHADE